MAKFKIYLMNSRSNNDDFSSTYSLMPISDFYTQYNEYNAIEKAPIQPSALLSLDSSDGYRDKHHYSTASFMQNNSFCYSYDEKFQIHQNTQRTLTFSMNRDVVRGDRIETNPFINYLFIGAQLLLVDKYNNHHLMTVSKISYEFQSLNTIFKYECQDSFNYQLSRQNAGYEIENNLNSVDFIGAQTLDWWVLCKIHPECKISYQYIPLNRANVAMGKRAYDAYSYPEFYRTIPFSASGTANSVLIALGELYGLQLKVYERVEIESDLSYGRCVKYYWFEPIKSLYPTGLKYSPHLDLQSFSLEHISSSFSSILNIQSHTLGEDLVTVLPTIPAFFRQWFETADWTNSIFTTGLFTSKCQEETFNLQYNNQLISAGAKTESNLTDCYKKNLAWYDSTNGYVYIPIILTDKLGYYPYIKFTTSNKVFSYLNIKGADQKHESVSQGHNSKYNEWKLIYKIRSGKYLDETISFNEDILYTNNSSLPLELIQQYGIEYCFLELPFQTNCTAVTIDGKLYVSQYRIPSYEELEFAEIADQVPWLENKLIDFRYFYEHSIITSAEHQALLNTLQNDLRKANAKLLLYTQLYYQAIQTKTKIMANLSAKLDKVGAVFQSDLINPFMLNGRANATTEFSLAMSDLFASSTETIRLMNYYETLSDYVNKYFNSEQSFLKNMYLFREYFNANSNLGTLYNYSFSISNPNIETNKIVTFANPNTYLKLTADNQHSPIYEKQENTYLPYDKNTIITAKNYKDPDLYYFNPKSDKKILISTGSTYSNEQTYYELQWEVQDESLMDDIFLKDGKYSRLEIYNFYGQVLPFQCELLDETKGLIHLSCYNHCLHTTDKTPIWYYKSGAKQVTNITPVFVPVTYSALRANFFYQQLNAETSLLNYTHYRKKNKEDRMQNTGKWPSSFDQLGLAGSLLTALGESKNIDSSDMEKLTTDTKVADKIYKQCFPLSSYYWKGKAITSENKLAETEEYHEVPFVNIENASQFYRRVAVSLEEYKNWQIATSVIGFVATGGGGLCFVPGGWVSMLVAPAIWGICSAVWNNGEKPFNNTGWSFHDVFNCDITAFQGWNNSTRLLYTKNAEGYSKTKKSSIFADDVINGETWVESEKAIIQDTQWGYYEATNLLLSYHSLSARLTDNLKKKYWYETSYYRILTIDDYVNKNDNFLILWYKNNEINLQDKYILSTQELKTKSGTKKIQQLDSTIYYPLKNHITSVSGSDFNWPESVTYQTLGDLFKGQLNYRIENESKKYILTDNNNTGAKIIVLKEETWNYQDLTSWESWTRADYDSVLKMSAMTIYDNSTFEKIDLISTYPELTIGFYINGTEDEDFLSTNQLTSFSDELEYYKKIDNEYRRYYTINQLIQRNNTYVKAANLYNYQSFMDEDKIITNYYIYTKENDNWAIESSKIGYLKKNNDTWYLTGESFDDIVCNVNITLQSFNNYTNGSFWYKYRNSESNLLMEKAMLIETNLMEYWTSAYYASKNCKFFLPEYWQPTVDQQKNYFSSQVLSEKEVATEAELKASVSDIVKDWDKYSPYYSATQNGPEGLRTTTISFKDHVNVSSIEITISQEGVEENNYELLSGQDNSFVLKPSSTPRNFKYKSTFSIDWETITFRFNADNEGSELEIEENYLSGGVPYPASITIVLSGKEFVTQNQIQLQLSNTLIPIVSKKRNQWRYQLKHQQIADSPEQIRAIVNQLSFGDSISLAQLAQENSAILEMVNYLDLEAENWQAMKLQNNAVLYEHESGGMLWTQLLDQLSSGALIYSQFGGWYDMMIRVLKSCNYEAYEPTQYNQAKETHDNIWRQIYTKYPNLCYEQSYSNSDATSSKELLQMAQWAFKDYTEPESNYNITVIDPNTLKGYMGQELKIGDGIEVDADEIYNDPHSDIYKSLIQYLYITDISYDLRRDDGIQLTVNNIKYSDKVIGQLIKLIR